MAFSNGCEKTSSGFSFGSINSNEKPEEKLSSGFSFGSINSNEKPEEKTSSGFSFGSINSNEKTEEVPLGTEITFHPTPGTDIMIKRGLSRNISTRHQCITVMREYERKSLEELRLEDYTLNKKAGTNAMNSARAALQKEGSVGLNPSTTFAVSCATATYTFPNTTSAFSFSNPASTCTFSNSLINRTPTIVFPSPATTISPFTNPLNKTFPLAFPGPATPTFSFSSPMTTTSSFSNHTTTAFALSHPTSTTVTFSKPFATSTTFAFPNSSTAITFPSPSTSPFTYPNSSTTTLTFPNPTTSPFTYPNSSTSTLTFPSSSTSPFTYSNSSTTTLTFPSLTTSPFTYPNSSTSTLAFSSPSTGPFNCPNSSTIPFTFPKPKPSTFACWTPPSWTSPSTFVKTDRTPYKFQFGTETALGPRFFIEASSQTENELCITKLLQGLKEMLLSSKHSDFVLNVKGKEFRVHKIILAAHSPVFAAMVEHDTKENASGVADIDDFESITFSNFLNFLYTGKVENLHSDNVLDLYVAADKYQVTELSNLCVKYMMNNISIENFCDILTLSLRHHVRELTEVATEFFQKNSKEIALTTNWATFLAENPVAGNELFLKVLNLKQK